MIKLAIRKAESKCSKDELINTTIETLEPRGGMEGHGAKQEVFDKESLLIDKLYTFIKRNFGFFSSLLPL